MTKPAYRSARTSWRADFAEATARQLDKAYRLVGISAEQHDENLLSVAAALAVIQAQQDSPALPDETWETVRVHELDIVQPPKDKQDPTSPASEAG